MRLNHIAIIVDCSDGHVNATLGIASELIQNGFRVSYAVDEKYAERVLRVGAHPYIYHPLDPNLHFLPNLRNATSFEEHEGYELPEALATWDEYVRLETDYALPQLESVYSADRPDLIVYDFRTSAAKSMAIKWRIPNIEHFPMEIPFPLPNSYRFNDDLVLVSIPKFLQRNVESLAKKFKFIGPIFSGRTYSGDRSHSKSSPTILVSGPSSSEPSMSRFRLAIEAFSETDFHVILSVGARVPPGAIGQLPKNFEIASSESLLDLLDRTSLFIGHGGSTSTLEALYKGVPNLIIPFNAGFTVLADRIAELGLGVCVAKNLISSETLRSSAEFVLSDKNIRARVMQAQAMLVNENKSKRVVRIIENFLESTAKLCS